jgi:hypothetical protein
MERIEGFQKSHPDAKELVKEMEYPTTIPLCLKPYKLNL